MCFEELLLGKKWKLDAMWQSVMRKNMVQKVKISLRWWWFASSVWTEFIWLKAEIGISSLQFLVLTISNT
jgi:hypothetical protein